MGPLELLDGTEFLRTLFSDDSHLFQDINLQQLAFHRDGPRLSFIFDIAPFPLNPPEEWVSQKYNAVQVTLLATGVRDIAIEGWSCRNAGSLIVSRNSDGLIAIHFSSEGVSLRGTFDGAAVVQLAPYIDTCRPPTGANESN